MRLIVKMAVFFSALLLGNLLTLVYAMMVRKKGERLEFVKRRGFEVSMGVLLSVPFALFLALLVWAAFYFPLTYLFGVQFSADARYLMLAAIYPLAYAYVLSRWIRENGLLR